MMDLDDNQPDTPVYLRWWFVLMVLVFIVGILMMVFPRLFG